MAKTFKLDIQFKNGKIVVPTFRYKIAGKKQARTYMETELVIPDTPGQTVRIYLDKDDKITTKTGGEHELILGEFVCPGKEFIEVEKKVGKEKVKTTEQKPVDYTKVPITKFDIINRG